MKFKDVLFCTTAFVPVLSGAKELPNIIYIVTDQQTASAMSCVGNTDVHTPNIDRLAQAGVLFTNAYCSAPLSGPSRASMFTGHTSHEIGLARNNVPMPDSLRATTLGVLMQHAGYECAYAGKWLPYRIGSLVFLSFIRTPTTDWLRLPLPFLNGNTPGPSFL